MAWTTSAPPCAERARADWLGVSTIVATNALKRLEKDRTLAVRGAAFAHLALLLGLAPVLLDPALALALVATGLTSAALAFALPQRASSAPATEGRSDRADPSPSGAAAARAEAAPEYADSHPAATRGALPSCAAAERDWADLMARISHELRTPLNAVLGFSDLMDRGLHGPLGHERYREYVRHIHESGRELLKSAEDTLAVTSLLASTAREKIGDVVPLDRVVADAWGAVARCGAPHGLTLRAEIPDDLDVICDRRAIRQSLVNLLGEALSRGAHGGTVLVTARAEAGHVCLAIAVADAGSRGRDPRAGGLNVALARALLELQGAALFEHVTGHGEWTATTRLEQAIQADFFAAGKAAAGH